MRWQIGVAVLSSSWQRVQRQLLLGEKTPQSAPAPQGVPAAPVAAPTRPCIRTSGGSSAHTSGARPVATLEPASAPGLYQSPCLRICASSNTAAYQHLAAAIQLATSACATICTCACSKGRLHRARTAGQWKEVGKVCAPGLTWPLAALLAAFNA